MNMCVMVLMGDSDHSKALDQISICFSEPQNKVSAVISQNKLCKSTRHILNHVLNAALYRIKVTSESVSKVQTIKIWCLTSIIKCEKCCKNGHRGSEVDQTHCLVRVIETVQSGD